MANFYDFACCESYKNVWLLEKAQYRSHTHDATSTPIITGAKVIHTKIYDWDRTNWYELAKINHLAKQLQFCCEIVLGNLCTWTWFNWFQILWLYQEQPFFIVHSNVLKTWFMKIKKKNYVFLQMNSSRSLVYLKCSIDAHYFVIIIQMLFFHSWCFKIEYT